MYTDTTPSHGLSKSYAQAVKEPPPPQSELPRHIGIIPPDDEWTDVSSVTSCEWPGSVKTECTLHKISPVLSPSHIRIAIAGGDSDASDPRNHPVKSEEQTALHIVTQMLEDVPWIDEDVDTRVPHAFAGQIKHCNRSRWRYTNIDLHPNQCVPNQCVYHVRQGEPPKPWRPFPGK